MKLTQHEIYVIIKKNQKYYFKTKKNSFNGDIYKPIGKYFALFNKIYFNTINKRILTGKKIEFIISVYYGKLPNIICVIQI